MLPTDIRTLFNFISPRYDLASTILSCGLNVHWLRQLVFAILDAHPKNHLDLCCGTGAVGANLTRVCRRADLPSIDCVDFSPSMIAIATDRLSPFGIRPFVADVTALPIDDTSYDTVSIAYGLRNIPDKDAALHEAARVLRPGGRLCILELTRPHRLVRPLHTLYLATLLPVLGWAITRQQEPYRYLSRSIQNFSVPECIDALRRHGFSPQIPKTVSLGIATLIIAEKIV